MVLGWRPAKKGRVRGGRALRKVYKGGLMSKHIGGLKVGDTLEVRRRVVCGGWGDWRGAL